MHGLLSIDTVAMLSTPLMISNIASYIRKLNNSSDQTDDEKLMANSATYVRAFTDSEADVTCS